MKNLLHISICCCLLLVTGFSAYAQQEVKSDSISSSPAVFSSDSTAIQQSLKEEKHSAHLATVYSAILPGLGQIYNKKWWKVPILYGGFATLGYFINYNNNYYVKYKQAYSDIIDDDPMTNSFMNLDIEGHWDWSNSNQVTQFGNRLNKAQESARRNRDMLIICTVGVYALQIIDAAVDAHFFDFDISDDLSLQWGIVPVQHSSKYYPGVGVQIQF
ncbi:MAG: DUF5683 domain-containing protein [Mangrovibacterium sp.]